MVDRPGVTMPVLELEVVLREPDRVVPREAVLDRRTVPVDRMEFRRGVVLALVRWAVVHRMRRCCR